MSLIVPKAYLDKRDEIIKKNDFRQMGLLIWSDSAPSDWLNRVQDCGYKALVSPCHDKDFLDIPGEDGKPQQKKPHYHIDIYFPGKKTLDQCQDIADYISGVPNYEVFYIVDREVHARYLCHLDSPKKHRYPVTEVLAFNGASYEKFVGTQQENEYVLEVIGDIIDWLRDNDIYYFDQLIDYAREHKNNQWITLLLKTGTPLIKSYLQGRTFRANDSIRNKKLANDLAISEKKLARENALDEVYNA